MIYHKQSRFREGSLVVSHKRLNVYQVQSNLFVLDIRLPMSKDLFFQPRRWVKKGFASRIFQAAVNRGLEELDYKGNGYLLSQNVFASALFPKIQAKKRLFDAWDNFLRFPGFSQERAWLESCYRDYGRTADHWTTNSQDNIDWFSSYRPQDNIHLLRNGVDTRRFVEARGETPLSEMPKPVIGFGGKISHMFDPDLFNALSDAYPAYSFVLLGQKLDKGVFERIHLRPNVFYLGDIHYDQYPNYVRSFDVGIVPYVLGEREHGADSIKAYEYLAAGLPVIGTAGNGLPALEPYLHLAKNTREFIDLLGRYPDLPSKAVFYPETFSWQSRVKELKDVFQQ